MLDETTRYRLLKLLQSNPEVSQRQVAEALGISVGKTNFCLRALLDKGLVKVRNFRDSQNKMAYAYYLTPKGAQEKVRATALFLQRNALPQIRFASHLPEAPVAVRCDRRLIGQALTNLLKNAAEAIDGRDEPETGELPAGEITLSLAEDADVVRIVIEDNGRGLPKEDRARLTEPYVTTRSKGTGLGLAIAKRVVEEMDGEIALEPSPEGRGTLARIMLPRWNAGVVAGDGLA